MPKKNKSQPKIAGAPSSTNVFLDGWIARANE